MELQEIKSVIRLPDRPIGGHKGLFGRVLVVGGHDVMIGAPAFAGTAALRMGSGLVQVAVDRQIVASVLSITPELIGLALPAFGMGDLDDAAEKADAIVVGPGLGQTKASVDRVKRLIRFEKPMVIDADALNILAEGKRWPKKSAAHAVLTPHPGEMKRLAPLLGRDDVPTDTPGRIDIAAQAANTFNVVMVLKGDQTVVTDGKRVYLNHTGDSSLSKAGTGDVLSGMIGCLLGQKIDRFDAACFAVHLHGLAGEIAGKKLGRRCVLARDVLDSISPALAEMKVR
jgi:NAD(P)H-hydrate epimerase